MWLLGGVEKGDFVCNLPLGVAASGSGGPFCGKARVAARNGTRLRI